MNDTAQKTILTIGHSIHSSEDFIRLLKDHNVRLLADIRSFPGSRKVPWFNKEILPAALGDAGIRYIHFPGLGGRRKVSKDSKNTGWIHPAFRGYADYMETDEFLTAENELEKIALRERTAIMCSEALYWRCHRSMVSDFLKMKGWKVLHIMSNGKLIEHNYTSPAKVEGGKLSYVP